MVTEYRRPKGDTLVANFGLNADRGRTLRIEDADGRPIEGALATVFGGHATWATPVAGRLSDNAGRVTLDVQAEWGGVPFVIVNDGDVTALAGSMATGDTGVLGIAMGTSEAVGYVTFAEAETCGRPDCGGGRCKT